MKKLNPSVSLYDTHLFCEGNHFKSYKFLGSKIKVYKGIEGTQFRIWAPNAKEVRVIGSFNDWNGNEHIMKRKKSTGFWSIFIPGVKEGDLYKYEILTEDNNIIHKSDPYAFYSEVKPNTASIVVSISGYNWKDHEWIKSKKEKNIYECATNIYEIHLGSWKRDEDDNYYSYRELADLLAPYVKEMGYTHVELLPILEHPYDGSWGYQATGYYSVTSRYGNVNDFKYFIDELHKYGIGVILDWVPGHFCKDAHGLYRFDGTPLYEYDNRDKAENYDWGTANFDLGKPEVRSFLISNAVFWFDVYHIDGIRVDAVANMLYLSYGGREPLNLKNKYGGSENLEAVDFIKKLNEIIFEYFSNPLMIAEESTSWPLVTKPTYANGLGFNYKWNMGWMNDILKYIEMDSMNRKYHHNLITFSLMYAFSENFILPISHDEVVHGKKSLLNKMPGSYEEKFSSLRAFYGYMMSHPGKKTIFMGCEFGQFIEWKFDTQLDWGLLLYPMHKMMQNYVKDLNHFYLSESALWEQDQDNQGFLWIDHQNCNQSIISFIRQGNDEKNFIIVICNFTPVQYEDYKVGVPKFINYKETFNSDKNAYGGINTLNEGMINSIKGKWHNRPYYINIKIPPLSTIFIKPLFEEKGGL